MSVSPSDHCTDYQKSSLHFHQNNNQKQTTKILNSVFFLVQQHTRNKYSTSQNTSIRERSSRKISWQKDSLVVRLLLS